MSASLDKVVEQEVSRLKEEMPTPQDIPSCTSHLDTYLSCLSMKSQIKAVYRYGERLPCSEKLDNFKFCMSMKWMDEDERYEAWIKRRAQWWAKRRVTDKSSENVWDARREPLKSYPPPLNEEFNTEGLML